VNDILEIKNGRGDRQNIKSKYGGCEISRNIENISAPTI
jgi:hypothetical protein